MFFQNLHLLNQLVQGVFVFAGQFALAVQLCLLLAGLLHETVVDLVVLMQGVSKRLDGVLHLLSFHFNLVEIKLYLFLFKSELSHFVL